MQMKGVIIRETTRYVVVILNVYSFLTGHILMVFLLYSLFLTLTFSSRCHQCGYGIYNPGPYVVVDIKWWMKKDWFIASWQKCPRCGADRKVVYPFSYWFCKTEKRNAD